MPATMTSRKDAQGTGTFLGGWGGVVSIILGITLALALYPVINQLVVLLHDALVSAGMTDSGATMLFYWAGFVAAGIGFLIAIAGSDVRMDRLRSGAADWAAVFREALIVLGVTSLWLFTAATWDNYVDEFNTYEARIELPAIGLLLLMIAAAIALRWVRRRRTPDGADAAT